MSTSTSHTTPSKARIMPWFTAVILVLGITIVAAVYWQRQVRVTELSVIGNRFTPLNDITGMVNLKENIHPDSLDLEALQKSLEELIYVEKAAFYIEPDGDLEITITERKPIGLLMQKSDRAYVDAHGVIMPVPDQLSADLPLIYGFTTALGDTLETDSFRQLRDFLIAARQQPLAWNTISEVAYDKNEGVVALTHENGVKLILGHNDFDRKVTHWNAFYSQIIRSKGIGNMQQVDLRFSNQIVSREVNR